NFLLMTTLNVIFLFDDGEGFKSSLRWNINGAKNDERITLEVLEAIAGFLNTGDGVLLIGVRDAMASLHGIASDGKIYHQRCQEKSRAADSNLRAVRQRSSFRVHKGANPEASAT